MPVSPVMQHRTGARRDALDEIGDAAHAGQGEEHVLGRPGLADLLLQEDVLRSDSLQLQRPADDELEVLVVERLEHVVRRALAHGFDRGLDRAVGGDQDDRQLRVLGANLLQEVDAAGLRHLEVGEDQVEARRAELLARLAGVGGAGGLEPHALDHDLQRAPHAAVVVDDEHSLHAATSATGSLTSKTVPRPGSLRSETLPRCALTTRSTKASPRPVPSSRPVTKGRKMRSRISRGTPGPSSATSKPTVPAASPSVRSQMCPPCGKRLHGVDQQVEDDLIGLLRIAQRRPLAVGEVAGDLDALPLGVRGRELGRARQHVAQRGRLEPLLERARELDERR